MEEWRLIDLGEVEPLLAQTFYEAVAHYIDINVSPNTIILVQPSSPYVCIGFHQELEKEIDVEYCNKMGLPIIRRSQGGGATYLDNNQVFYQVIAKKNSKVIPTNIEKLFEKLLKVTIYVYQELGLPAEFKPINDVIVNGRKISGNGAGEYGESTIILVGNIILDLDYDSMGRVLKVPSEKFRDKMVGSMREWVTSIKRELGYIPPVKRIKELLIKGYEHVLGIKLINSEPTNEEKEFWKSYVKTKHLSKEWLYMPEGRHGWLKEGRVVKVAEGIKVVEVSHKAKKLIRLTAEVVERKITNILISGDFFMIPEGSIVKLEEILKGASLNRNEILERINKFYNESKVQTPGINAEDFTDAIMKLQEFL